MQRTSSRKEPIIINTYIAYMHMFVNFRFAQILDTQTCSYLRFQCTPVAYFYIFWLFCSLLLRSTYPHSELSMISTSFDKKFVSEITGRRFLAAVVTLDSLGTLEGGNGRLRNFINIWNQSWPGLSFKRQQSFLHRPSLLSYGLLASFHTIFCDAIDYNGSFDYLLLFEDDAIPFAEVTWPPLKDNDLDRRLDLLEQWNGGGLVLGGHKFRGYNKFDIKRRPCSITRGKSGYGSYGFVLPRGMLMLFRDVFQKILKIKKNYRGVADGALWTALKLSRENLNTTGGYISVPLLVDHRHGYSHTWRGVRRRHFEGSRKFWKFKD